MAKYATVLGLLACGWSSGCAAPLVTPRPLSFQSKAAYASDWKALAERSVDRFAATLHTTPPKVFVAPGPADMPFAAAYRQNLEQALLARGYPVVKTSADAVVLSFSVQPYLYKGREKKEPADYATFWTTSYAIGSQLRHVTSLDTGAAIALASGPALDLLAALNDTTNAEVTVTTTVSGSDRLHYADAETIYVHPADLARFYWTAVPAAEAQSMPRHANGLAEVGLPVFPRR